jgi:phosphoglucosamine mutase
MQKNGYTLGGEQSGHIIMKKYATTGDGILTAIMVAEEVCDKKSTLSSLTKNVTLFPQISKSFYVRSKDEVMVDSDIKDAVGRIESELTRGGRILLRKSGTEPVIRIMAECPTEEECIKYISELKDLMVAKGYVNEQK